MGNVLATKMEKFTSLSPMDVQFLDRITAQSRIVSARTHLISEDGSVQNARLIVEGFACRYKRFNSGRRQIVAYLVGGDLCNLNALDLNVIDRRVESLSPCRVVEITAEHIAEMNERPALARALHWMILLDQATSQEWLANVGQRAAVQRVAHLFCELYTRLDLVGLASNGRFAFPVIQDDMADAVGLSLIHFNRCLQRLREMKLLKLRRRWVEIGDVDRLAEFADFNANYLDRGEHTRASFRPELEMAE